MQGARSSVVERPAHNRLVVGSNPAGPTTPYRIHNSPVEGDLCGVCSLHRTVIRRRYGVDDGGKGILHPHRLGLVLDSPDHGSRIRLVGEHGVDGGS